MIKVESLLDCPFTVNVHRYDSIALPAKGSHVFKSEAEYLPYKEVLVALEKDGMLKLSAGEAANVKMTFAPKAEAPKADAPVADAPVADAPVADAPVADPSAESSEEKPKKKSK